MQSDSRVTIALDSLREPIEQYRSAMSGTRAQMSDYLALHREETDSRANVAAVTLGQFAGGRVDSTRFAAAFEGSRTLTSEDTYRIERCIGILDELLACGDSLFLCDVPAGERLDYAIDARFANLGRAFGAALVFQAVRTQVFRDATHLSLLDSFPFERWNRLERLVAPPLVVSVDGSDLDAGCIARFLDGRTRIALVVRNAVAPAPMMSVITPGAYVAQATDATGIAKMIEARGSAVVALIDETAARFVHNPAGGPRLVDRLSVQAIPSEISRRAIGRCSASQQAEQLAQLETLVAASRAEARATATQAIEVTTALAASAAEGRTSTEAVDALAGWLLTQARITEQVAR